MKTEGSSSEKHFKLAAEELKRVGKGDIKGFQPVLKKKEFIFRVGARSYSKMSQRSIYTEKKKVADVRKKGEYLPIFEREEYMSQGRKTLLQRQRYEEKISIHPRDNVYMADRNKNEFYWQKEKRYNPCSGDKVVTSERAQQRNLAALEKNKVADERKKGEYLPIFEREEYMSQGRKTLLQRQRYEEKISIHPRDNVYKADRNKKEVYWQKEKRYNPCSGDKVVTFERAQQRNLAALEKNKVADERKKGEYLPIFEREEYMSQGRKTLLQRQRYEEKISIHPRDNVYKADRSKNEVYWQKEKRYNPYSGDKVVTSERAQQRNLAALERKRRVAEPKDIVPVFPEDFQFAVNFPFGPNDVYKLIFEFDGWYLRGNQEIPDWARYSFLSYWAKN
ncbi:hypothetical protein QYM36_015823 [Artemia franciscana]|uniref:Uncharacterized protein n=1 Tax=Artemia franciscana TaxID=6661 RepID=A0AA88HB50_ARTSF|nr:hypothetical protein QYM36_015823 [Artemia franciscana]